MENLRRGFHLLQQTAQQGRIAFSRSAGCSQLRVDYITCLYRPPTAALICLYSTQHTEIYYFIYSTQAYVVYNTELRAAKGICRRINILQYDPLLSFRNSASGIDMYSWICTGAFDLLSTLTFRLSD
jgi:hypothetical protein